MKEDKEITTEEHYAETAKRQALRIKDLEEDNEILKQTLVKNEERMKKLEDIIQKLK